MRSGSPRRSLRMRSRLVGCFGAGGRIWGIIGGRIRVSWVEFPFVISFSLQGVGIGADGYEQRL